MGEFVKSNIALMSGWAASRLVSGCSLKRVSMNFRIAVESATVCET